MPAKLHTSPTLGEVWIFDPWFDRPPFDGRPAFHRDEIAMLTAAKLSPADWRAVADAKVVFGGGDVVDAWHWPTLRKQRERAWARSGWTKPKAPPVVPHPEEEPE